MTISEFLDERYRNRPDKDNIYGVGISDREFIYFAIHYLLGEDWYVVDPLGNDQVNEIALLEILERYSRKYRKESRSRENKNENRKSDS